VKILKGEVKVIVPPKEKPLFTFHKWPQNGETYCGLKCKPIEIKKSFLAFWNN